MKIRTQILAVLVVFALIIAVISVLMVTTNQELERLSTQGEIAGRIALEVGELGYLSNDYILYREPRQAERWQAQYASVSDLIGRLSVNRPEQQVIAENLAVNFRNTGTVFEGIASGPASEGGTDTAVLQLFWSRMAVQNQGMIFDAGRLENLLEAEAEGLEQERNLLIVTLAGTFVALLLTSYLLFYRRTMRSIDDLQVGTAIIGSGDLTHVIDGSADDEIGELAQAFNRMTRSLNTVTATKADLEREIAERKQAEAALRESEGRLKALYGSMSEGLADHQIIYRDGKAVDYRILDVNPAFEEITGLPRLDAVGRKASELYGTGNPPYLDIYARVASGGSPEQFEVYFPPMGKHFSISVFSPEKGRFATVFQDITERRMAEEVLRESEFRYRTVADNTSDWEFWLDPEGRFLYCSPSCERIIGHPAGEFLADPGLRERLIHPDDLAAFQDHVREIGERHTSGSGVWRMLHADGTWRWIDHVCTPVYGTAGEYLGVRGSNRDITDRKLAEQELHDTSQYLENLITYANAPIIVWDPQFRITRFNRAFERLTGRAAGEVLGRDLAILFPGATMGESMENIRRAMAGERWEAVEIPILHRSGEVRTVLWNSATLYGADGKTVTSAIAQGQDITERIRAEEALHETSQYLENLINHANAPIIVWDPEFRITRFNRAFERLTGRTAEEVVGHDLGILFPGETKEESMDRIRRTMTGERWEAVEIPILHRSGEVRTVLWNSATLYGADGKTVTSAIAQGQDITDRKRAEEALRESEERFRTLYQGLPVSAVVFQRTGEDFVIRDYNQASQAFTGGRMQDFLGRRASELYASTPAILEKFALAWDTKTPQTYHSRYRKLSTGQDIFLTLSVAYVPPDRILVLSEDDTELKNSEETLRETSQYLENLINYANAPIIVWDSQLRITRFNHAFERLTGWTAEEVVGRNLGILFPEESKEVSMDHIRRTMAGERWEVVEIPILQRGGGERIVLWNSATLMGPDGETVESAIAQGQDITERKRMEEEVGLKTAEIAAANVALREEITQRIHAGEALERTMSLLKATFESTADGILSTEKDGTVAGFNQNYVSMWNVPFALLQTPDLEEMTRHMAAQLVDPEGFMATNAELLSHPGRESYDMLELRDGRIFERDSRPQRIEHDIVGRIWSYRDITERKRAEERVLASLNEKEVLLREIHHRVKNNLQLISGLLDLTRLRTQDPETLSILTDMMLKIQTMAQIHTRLYESKQFDRINMGTQIRDQITSLSQIYGQRDREILCETELADLYLPIDQAIPCALVVNEILSNAFKHAFKGRAHGSLRVMASQEDSRVRITVRDDGRGIPPDLDIARSRSLGLKLIRNLVENQLKGSLTIRREGGTEVIVEFPILTQEEEHVTDSRSGR